MNEPTTSDSGDNEDKSKFQNDSHSMTNSEHEQETEEVPGVTESLKIQPKTRSDTNNESVNAAKSVSLVVRFEVWLTMWTQRERYKGKLYW